MATRMQEEEEEDQEMGPILVDRLESCGINNSDVTKLKDGGFHTVEAAVTRNDEAADGNQGY